MSYWEPSAQIHHRTYHNNQKWSFSRSKSYFKVQWAHDLWLIRYDPWPTISIMVITSASSTLFSRLLMINICGLIFDWFNSRTVLSFFLRHDFFTTGSNLDCLAIKIEANWVLWWSVIPKIYFWTLKWNFKNWLNV